MPPHTGTFKAPPTAGIFRLCRFPIASAARWQWIAVLAVCFFVLVERAEAQRFWYSPPVCGKCNQRGSCACGQTVPCETTCPECARWGYGPHDCVAPAAPGTAPGAAPAPGAPGEFQPTPADLGGELFADNFGTGYGYESAAPNIIGDFFGGGSQSIVIQNTVPVAIYVRGFLAGGSPGAAGAANALWVFESGPGTPNDFTSSGSGTDGFPDLNGNFDTFAMSEPLPPNDSPVSPGPTFVYDGGTVVYTNSPTETTAQDGPMSDGDLWYATYGFTETIAIEIPAGGGAVVRRIKLAENNSPEPRDRFYWNYNYFNNVPFGFGDVNRYVFGFEKTFRSGGMSIDARFPFASTLSANQIADGVGSRNTEFGNITLIWKTLLYDGPTTLVSGGLGVALPTARDTQLYRTDGRQVLELKNEAVHLLPYVAMLHAPNESFFVQGFVQFDIDANGNPTTFDYSGATLQPIGTLQDVTYLFADLSLGYRLYRDPNALLTSVIPVVELHYSSTLQDADTVSGNGITITGVTPRFDVLNLTAGVHCVLGDRLVVTPAVAVPLRDGDDQQFDMEAMVLANWYF